MVELIGDICEPSVLIAPREHEFEPAINVSGAIFISGGLLSVISGANLWTVNMTQV